jgi:hypothetical protein
VRKFAPLTRRHNYPAVGLSCSRNNRDYDVCVFLASLPLCCSKLAKCSSSELRINKYSNTNDMIFIWRRIQSFISLVCRRTFQQQIRELQRQRRTSPQWKSCIEVENSRWKQWQRMQRRSWLSWSELASYFESTSAD